MKTGCGALFALVVSACAVTEDWNAGDPVETQSEPKPDARMISKSGNGLDWEKLKGIKSPFAITRNREGTLYLRVDRDLDQVFMLRVARDGGDPIERVVPVGREPVSIVLNNAETRAYVSNLGDGTISVLDVTASDSVAVVDSVRIASTLFCLIFSRRGESLYAVSRYGDKVWVVDPTVNQVVGTTSIRQLDLNIRRECYSGCHAQDPQRRRVLDRISKDVFASID